MSIKLLKALKPSLLFKKILVVSLIFQQFFGASLAGAAEDTLKPRMALERFTEKDLASFGIEENVSRNVLGEGARLSSLDEQIKQFEKNIEMERDIKYLPEYINLLDRKGFSPNEIISELIKFKVRLKTHKPNNLYQTILKQLGEGDLSQGQDIWNTVLSEKAPQRKEAINFLISDSQDTSISDNRRGNTIFLLGDISQGNQQVTNYLISIIQDTSEHIYLRRRATESLGKITLPENPEAIKLLISIIQTRDLSIGHEWWRTSAAKSLRQIVQGSLQDTISLVISTIQNTSDDIGLLEEIVQFLNSITWDKQQTFTTTIYDLPTGRIIQNIDALISIMQNASKDIDLRYSAANALGNINSMSFYILATPSESGKVIDLFEIPPSPKPSGSRLSSRTFLKTYHLSSLKPSNFFEIDLNTPSFIWTTLLNLQKELEYLKKEDFKPVTHVLFLKDLLKNKNREEQIFSLKELQRTADFLRKRKHFFIFEDLENHKELLSQSGARLASDVPSKDIPQVTIREIEALDQMTAGESVSFIQTKDDQNHLDLLSIFILQGIYLNAKDLKETDPIFQVIEQAFRRLTRNKDLALTSQDLKALQSFDPQNKSLHLKLAFQATWQDLSRILQETIQFIQQTDRMA